MFLLPPCIDALTNAALLSFSFEKRIDKAIVHRV